MLFFSGIDVLTLRRFANSSHAHLAEALLKAAHDIMEVSQLLPPKDYKQFGRTWNEGFGNNLPPLAMHVLLRPADDTAFSFIRRYMDRLEHYRHWQVLARYKEDLPVACTLTGFATSLDMLYAKFDEVRRTRYMDKVRRITQLLYEASLTKPWGHKYLNHRSITNYLAVFIGSLVVEPHHPDAAMWKRHAVIMLERNLQILSFVRDGSFSEGLGYGANSFRGISQYLYLLRRHLRLDHSSHPWLQKHIDFYLHTAIPGLQRTLGVGDTYSHWVYGPESQLHFLDTFIKKTGKGHWMAAEIRKRRDDSETNPLWYQKYATLHTEFIWYNPNIRARPPGTYASSSLHEFKDWGVVVYRAGPLMDPSSTFLSFKSGRIHGAGVFELVHHFTNDEVLVGWDNFNPSHQHPDQNSLTFWLVGIPFITGGLYGPKYPYLENTLMFAPSGLTSCSHPYAGQMGSCGHYFQVLEAPDAYGEVVVVSKKQGYVFTSGEAARAYHPDLGVRSFYRSLLLLHKELLVIVDHIHLNTTSRISHVSSSFNNHVHQFENIAHPLGLNGLGLKANTNTTKPLDKFQSLWMSTGNKSPFARILNLTYPGSPETGRAMWVSNARVTFELEGERSRMIYIFHGPSVQLRKLKVIRSAEDSLTFALDTGYQDLIVAIATEHSEVKVLCSVTDIHSESTTLFTAREPESPDEKEALDIEQWEAAQNSSLLQKFMLKLRNVYQPKETGGKGRESQKDLEKMKLIANLTYKSAEYYARIKKAQLLQAKWNEVIRAQLLSEREEQDSRPESLWYSLIIVALSNLLLCLFIILLLKVSTHAHRKRIIPLIAACMTLLFTLLCFY
ncbi:hypothetical protein CAPTEDRAFT_160278 [Capitella teleta]|uniref:Uncharacterized protein n=1 Tax=Capitella teleta TaxID=283909 RepID=R7ULN8_CAPTE|nr:hypothetical protein CAPTEDRAFT_160278 [Capitella teleta]|eukprot:ELU04192.1 hypothetical protein CAPTEDRAFT_160278 [Capitella teleta]